MLIGAVLGTSCAVAVLVAAEVRGDAVLKAASKTLASVGFVGTGVLAGLASGTPVQRVILAGLVLGAVGDVCLLSREKRWFLAGLSAFLLNHLAYVGAFVGMGVAWGAVVMALVPLGVAAAAVWRWIGPRAGSLGRPVLAYILVICSMVACAVGAAVAQPARWPLLLGACLFFASDLAVARDRFVASGPGNKVWGLPTYYGSQLLFAVSA